MVPENSTTSQEQQVPSEKALQCGDVGTYREQQKKESNGHERDHVPATSRMLRAGEDYCNKNKPPTLTEAQKTCFQRFVKMDALSIAIPKPVHRGYSRTCSNRGGTARLNEDLGKDDLGAKDDFAEIEPHLDDACKKKYQEAQAKMLEQLPDKLFKECQKKAKDECE